MQKTKRKATTVRKIPPLRIINFTKEDVRANAKGNLTKVQKQELYRLSYKKHLSALGIAIFPVLFLFFNWVISTFGYGIALVVFVIEIVAVLLLRELFRYYLLKDIKIIAFSGTARPQQDGSRWYIEFDNIMKFEITDQPNKLFKPEHRYRVFMTNNENIILSARALEAE